MPINIPDFGIKKLFDLLAKATGLQRMADLYDLEFDRFRIGVMAETVSEASIKGASVVYDKQGLEIKPKSEFNLQRIEELPESNLLERSEKRQSSQKIKAQTNIEKVAIVAAGKLEGDSEVNADEVDEDWVNRFFRIVEDVSNEKMQILWGRILAGEVKRPGSFSLRTLNLLQNLTRTDADLITKIGSFVIYKSNYPIVYRNGIVLELGLNFKEILHLQEIGILHASDHNTTQLYGGMIILKYFTEHVFISSFGLHNNETLPICTFTQPGREILNLISPIPNPDYFDAVIKAIIEFNLSCFSVYDRYENACTIPYSFNSK
jgi:hypothetical protein